jgi:hypothetical protein
MTWDKDRHEAAQKRCEAATEGPWMIGEPGWISKGCYSLVNPKGNVIACQILSEDDAQLMRQARADLPDALAEIERLRARVAELEAALRTLAPCTRCDGGTAKIVRHEVDGWEEVACPECNGVGYIVLGGER